MKTLNITLYDFDELSREAKDVAIGENRYINVDHFWWDFIYDDAKTAGLKIKGFDIDRRECHMVFEEDAVSCAILIMDNHGSVTPTYQKAERFWKERQELIQKSVSEQDNQIGDDDSLTAGLESLGTEFLKCLIPEYLNMLQHEYEYLTGDRQVADTLMANGYPFWKDGQMATIIEMND